MKQLTVGVIAHVDAGKTTLSEALLYHGGVLKQLGRVDNGDAFLDPDRLEKQRGITIYLHQARLAYHDMEVTLLDAPGHADFASQAEQMLSVLDYAVLVVSAMDGVQGYTRTLWQLLTRYNVPTLIFINKVDAPSANVAKTMQDLKATFGDGCVLFDDGKSVSESASEEIALTDETLLDTFMHTGTVSDAIVQERIKNRQLFPCFAGSALKDQGVTTLLDTLETWGVAAPTSAEFGARVFKISHDDHGERLTWLRMTGGALRNRQSPVAEEKVNEIRAYNGTKYTVVPELTAGEVGAVTGLKSTYAGQGLGDQADAPTPMMAPVLTYGLDPLEEDIYQCLDAVQLLADEDRELTVSWVAQTQEIQVQLMGEMQLEVLTQQLQDRFGLKVAFNKGQILYRETISRSVEGVGHFEPLRHYAEVHLLLEPLPIGSGLVYKNIVSPDELDRNWQHQVMTNLSSKTMVGVLTGSPITDLSITLISGRGSIKHSVGGDFREATWRAVRQGLMELRQMDAVTLLEPWYQFELEVDQDLVGRAMTDIQRMHGSFETPETVGERTVIRGRAPVSDMQSYGQELNAYSHGQGRLDLVLEGYRPCHDQDEVVAAKNYQPVSDLPNTPDSVFCAHGAGYPVPWDQLPEMAHVAYQYPL